MVTVTGWGVNLTNTTIGAHDKTLPRNVSNSFPKSINFLSIRSMLRGRILRVLFEIYPRSIGYSKTKPSRQNWRISMKDAEKKRAGVKPGLTSFLGSKFGIEISILTLLQQINCRDECVHMYMYTYIFIWIYIVHHPCIHIIYLFNSCCDSFFWEIKLQLSFFFFNPQLPPKNGGYPEVDPNICHLAFDAPCQSAGPSTSSIASTWAYYVP